MAVQQQTVTVQADVVPMTDVHAMKMPRGASLPPAAVVVLGNVSIRFTSADDARRVLRAVREAAEMLRGDS